MTPPRRAAERGYNLVALVMAVMLLNVLVAAALPLWSAAIRRDREEELISRGLQYAEAIRVFQKRFGRLPNRLQELRDVNPRSIRQLWHDPITGEPTWGLLLDGVGTPVQIPGQPPPPEPIGNVAGDGSGEGEDGGSPFGTPQLPTGPIRGVRSLSTDEGFKTFFDKQSYREWEFRVDLVQGPPLGTPIGYGGGAQQPRLNANVIGRPFRYPPPGGMPTMPGAPGSPGAPGVPVAPGSGPGAPPQPTPGGPGIGIGGAKPPGERQ
ncbi:MAG: type II secretion system GspH family protein [Thermoanaerobaculia bacterium]|nr:type II secretion system GspH family protein [Thermoanaerobaculia bacterium]MCZ7651977.1 hypothetical protein [Thermoanaerobaculia bacterium]